MAISVALKTQLQELLFTATTAIVLVHLYGTVL